jgi:two-component system sensor histidine kinase EvgS
MNTPHLPPQPAEDAAGRPETADPAAEISRLRQSEARYRAMFEQSVMGILVGNAHGVVQDANPMALALLGYDRQSLVGRNMRDIVHPDDQGLLSVADTPRACLEGRTRNLERRYRRGDGSYLPVVVHFGLLDQKADLYQLMFQDSTERQAAEAARREALAQAQAASQVKSAFLAHMSHEIRTPLNGIMGMLQLAQTACPTAEVSDYLDTAMESARALLRILSDVLEVSDLHSGQVRLAQEDFDLDEAIGPVAASLAYEANLKGLAFTHDVAPDVPPRLRGDAGRLRQILYNLSANAIKFTPAGRVTLTVSAGSQADPGQISLVFALSDTGIGIPDSCRQAVLEAFAQADSPITRRFGGVGLGLAIAKGLAEEMGGTIALDSVENQGTTVRVELPFGLPEPAPCRSFGPTPCLAGRQVLVAEDEAVNRLTIRVMLQKLGCRPHLTENGRQALQALAGQSFDCVLMDMRMPELDGLSAVRAIRAGEAGEAARTVPVIALTAHALPQDREAALAAGVNDYLVKPIEMADLARALGRSLASCRTFQEPADDR